MKTAKDYINELALQVKEEVKRRLAMYDDLGNSKLYRSIDTEVVDSNAIVFSIADYFTFVASGRKPGWGTPPPSGFIEGIIKWVKEKNIRFEGKTENQTTWAIIRSIVNNGIRPRPFINPDVNGNTKVEEILPFLDDFFQGWADSVFDDIIKNLNI